jgi:iron(II)-dependent oxidoreductase
MMGSAAGGDEQPIHEQCFDSSFYLDRYEVTQAQLRALDGMMAADFAFAGERRPVENITWFEARDYCARRGARLPTEREWEYAARGPDSLTYPWGNTFVDENVVYNRTDAQGTVEVIVANGMPARPNGASWVGALDMSGSVWEWTSTRYDELDWSRQTFDLLGLFSYPYRADDGREADETRAEADQRRPLFTLRVVRGGSYAVAGTLLRGAARFGLLEGEPNTQAGFRCARA